MRARSCACNWVNVGSSLGHVWFRGSRRRFVAVRPDGTVVGADYRARNVAILALVWDARRREGLAGMIELGQHRQKSDGFARGILSMLSRVSLGN